ncbi:MAG: hypothetical protein K2M86_03685, partial [Odoribacter sp.]|nr:hypothetical protein [Odoribacter sp.]
VLTGIRWFRIGTPNDEEIPTSAQNHDLELEVTEADLAKSPLLLRAEMHYSGACSGVLDDTVSITWQEEQVIDVESDITVCQASMTGVALGQKVSIRNSNAPATWKLETTDKGTWDGDQLIFKPGDVSGMVELTVTAQGMATCPPKMETVNIEILAAPLSGGIQIEGERCSTRELSMKPKNEWADNGYTWNFGDGNTGTGVPAKNSYEQPGTYTVTMTGQFRNGCWREETQEVTVHLRPTPSLTMQNPAPVTRPTEITSTSTPENLTCNWRIDGRATYSGSSVSHRFSSEGTHSVLLAVETPEGCKDTARLNLKALAAPVAKFEVVVNPCTGKVEKLENLSELHEATIAWDFGNDSSVSHDWEPADQFYPLAYKDTTYTIRLRLENISDTVEYTQRVSVTSNLEPDFEVWEPDHCVKTDKEIRIKTQGKAEKTTIDWGDGTVQEWTLDNQVSVLSHTYPENESPASNNYTISLTAKNACHQPAPVTEVVTIVPVTAKAVLLKDVDTKQYQNTCYGYEQAFWNKSFGFIPQGYACEWDFGDGTPLVFDTVTMKAKAHLFEKPGVYQVRLRVKDECNEKQAFSTVTVIGNDSLDFAFDKDKDNLCTGDSVRIRFVQRGEAPFANLKWTLPDGTRLSNVNTLYYKFKKPGEALEMMLEAEADGCPTRAMRQCVVRQTPEPLIEFTRNGVNPEGCTPLSLPFVAVNGKGGTENMRFLWDFGDGSSSTERQPPVKVFEQEGKYKVKLEMEASYGCVGRDSLNVTAKITPKAAFVLDRHLVCSDEGDFEITAFNRTASAEDCSFEWYKGNEPVSLNPDSVSVSFVDFYGKEKIALRATHKLSGCDSRMIDSIVASLPLKASLAVSPDTVCAGMEVVFRDTLSLAGATREFYFDDGTLDDSREVRKTYW